MRKLVLLFIASIVVTTINAQSLTDAVRYGQQNITGTARYNAMGGAFGAVGGDISAINNNPAGSSIFNSSYASFSLSVDSYDNDTNYFNGTTSTDDSDLNFNQAGGVFLFNNRSENSPFKKMALGFNYDRTANFDNDFIASGISSNSIDSYFLGYAQDIPLDLLQLRDNESITDLYDYLGTNEGYASQQALLGYQAFILDPVSEDANNTEYISNINPGDFDQEYNFLSHGYNSKASLNLSTQYGNNLYLGLNLNTHFLDYSQRTILFEDNNNTNSQVTSLRFENNLRTFGNGFSFQLGGILQASPSWRIGATYDSPTWFNIEEETTQRLSTDGDNGSQNISPDVVNIYDDYRLKTPGKLTGSVAYIFGTQGLLSFDYSYQDYGETEFKPKDDLFFQNLNGSIENELKEVSTYRVGGEYRIADWSLRAGYQYQESPYENESTLGDLTSYSAGLGYSFGVTRIDLAYSRAYQESNPSLYTNGLTNTAFVDGVNSTITATLSFRL